MELASCDARNSFASRITILDYVNEAHAPLLIIPLKPLFYIIQCILCFYASNSIFSGQIKTLLSIPFNESKM